MAPLWNPLDLARGSDRFFFESVDRAEPLVGGSVEYGRLAAPAVRILMHDILVGNQSAALGEVFDYLFRGLISF